MENVERENVNGVEDEFLKIKELEKYLVEDEAREYGLKKEKKNKRKRGETVDEDEEGEDEDGGEDEEDEDGEEEDDELGLMGLDDNGDDDDEDGKKMETARYEDFFGGKRTGPKRKSKHFGGSDDSDMDEPNDDNANQKKQSLSTHEKELERLRSEIEEIEKANLEPKTWTMQGEGRFDDVQKPPTLLSKAPREKKELDENKSKKGLAELYEDEYAQKTGLVSTALSFSDEQKKEASMLFKKLCVKLDALSHFHFTPKPVIEDMSIQANVPALAMEEIAPLAVSDAAMLAPEEVFSGKGDVKEETELTKAERKRRRANKKRKFKAEAVKRMAIKAQLNASTKHGNAAIDSHFHYLSPEVFNRKKKELRLENCL
ncbi:UNVERIFIED_CONTAM: U3 small nucleolar ribonucleoprotein MPP10 [Sesamum radiatum]|uniref:U3 small nucleolar ribonucleoprotein MPP10 n=1 Tax=Sesamum radiatum TaxID=300843 RepID=A0AAW2RYF4_SESRA